MKRIPLMLGLAWCAAAAYAASPPFFNGRDLTGWSSWLKGSGHEDPRGVFSVVDGMLRISGEGRGYLGTRAAWSNYVLRLEYRWGSRTDGSGYVRNSGILLHANGVDGGAGGTWMASVEVQLAQGCEGDLIVIRGRDAEGRIIRTTLTSDTRTASDGKTRWQRGGTPTPYRGRQFWWSKHQPGFRERLDTRGEHDLAGPLGEWTRVECRCAGDRITVKINGETVNEAYDVFPAGGRILLQNEGNEIFFRKLTLTPL